MKSPLSRRIRLFHVLVALLVVLSLIPPQGMLRVSAEDPAPSDRVSSERSVADRAPAVTPQAEEPPARSLLAEPVPTIPVPTPFPLNPDEVTPPFDPEAAPVRLRLVPASLKISAQPSIVEPGDRLMLSLAVDGREAVAGVTISAILPFGVAVVGEISHDGRFDAADRRLVWELPVLPSDVDYVLSASLMMEAPARDLAVLRFTLEADGYEPQNAEAQIVQHMPAHRVDISPEGGVLISNDNRVRVAFPEGAVDAPVQVEHRVIALHPDAAGGPAYQFELTAATADEARTPVERFGKPYELRVDLAGLVDFENLAYWEYPYLGYWDEEKEEWVEIPSRRDGSVLVAELDHFTLLVGDIGKVEEYGWAPLANEPSVSLFDGGFHYTYPIGVPEGRGGLTPELTLSYNSRRVDGILTWVQSDWVGIGWSLDMPEIVRKVTPSYGGENHDDWKYGWVDWENEFTLVYEGVAHKLVPSMPKRTPTEYLSYGRYRTEDETFFYIERRNNTWGGNGSPSNETSEYWLVKLRDGTTFRLGYGTDSEQVIYTKFYDGDEGDECHWGENNYPPQSEACYAGGVKNRVTFRWRTDLITDTNGNMITMSYDEDICDEGGPLRDCASYLSAIQYNKVPWGESYDTKILFNRVTRNDRLQGDQIGDDWDNRYFYQADVLRSIETQRWGTDSYTTTREYVLDYECEDNPEGHNNHTRYLETITEYGAGGQDGGQALPETVFVYDAEPNKSCRGEGSEWDQESFRYPRLVQIENAIGGVATTTYAGVSGSVVWEQPTNYRVVSQTSSGIQGGGWRRTFSYPVEEADRCYDRDDDGYCERWDEDEDDGPFIGYRFVTETLSTLYDTPPITISVTRHDFELNSDNDPHHRLGKEWKTQWLDPSGIVLKMISTTWGVSEVITEPKTAYFVYPQRTEQFVRDNGSLPGTPQSARENQYVLASGMISSQKDILSNVLYRQNGYLYFRNEGAWIVDKPYRSYTADAEGSTNTLDHYYYDDNSLLTVPSRGNLTEVQRSVTSSGPMEYITIEQVAYDAGHWYVPVESTDGEDNVTHVTYDPLYVRPLTVTQAYGDLDHVTGYEYGYDAVTIAQGQVTKVTGPNGAATATQYRYDAFGRLHKIVRPGDSLNYPTVEYEYCDTCRPVKVRVAQRIESGQPGVLNTFRFYDGLGHLIQENQATSDSSEMIVQSYAYGAQGLQARVYVPYTTTFSVNYVTPTAGLYSTTLTYDAMGRVTAETRPDGTTVRTGYDGLDYAVLDESGRQRLYQGDALGRVTTIREYDGWFGSPDPNTGMPPYATTSYGYDELDQLTVVTDTLGNLTTMSHDMAGRKIAMSDPDMGEWSYAYDDVGNLISQIDARGQRTCLYYDGLNRLIGKSYDCGLGDCPDEPQDVVLSYDYSASPSNYGIGYVDRITETAESVVTSYAYDARGRTWGSWQDTDPGEHLRLGWSYDARDAVSGHSYPGSLAFDPGETISMTLDGYGRASSLTGTSTYVFSVNYDAQNRLEALTFGNNMRTDWIYSAPDTDGGRLQEIQTGSSGDPDALQHLAYTYDDAGDVMSVADAISGQVSYQGYDTLHRLTASYTTAGADRYDLQYAYDRIGNTSVVTDVMASSVFTYAHDAHRLTSTTDGEPLWYDADGNLTLSYWHGDARALAYDPENRLIVAGLSEGGERWIANFGSSAGGWTTYGTYPRAVGDVDGDGYDDIIGFGSGGTNVALSNGDGTFGTSTRWINDFGTNQGWSSYDTYPRAVGDFNGDGKADVVGFWSSGTYVALSTGSSFAAKTLWYAYYGTSAGGWTSQDVYPRVVGDVDGDGDDDIVGFGSAWVYVAKSNGANAFATRELWMDYFAHSKGWTSQNTYPRAVGDVNGDGMADCVGFGNMGTFICYSTGTTLTARIYLSEYFGKTSEGYSSQESYPRLLGDVDGDGRADLVGWKDEGVHIALSRGSPAVHDSCAPTLWLEEQANDQGWTSFNIRPRALGDADGDGRADLVGFAPDGTYVARFDRQTRFLYDGSGSRVVRIQSDTGGITRTVYAGEGYEYASDGATSETTKYYSLGGRRVALRDGQGVSYLHPDHLGSTMVTSGAASSSQRYLPYGGQRGAAEVATDWRYTGQRWQAQFGLYDYNARWYDPELGRFVQPDTVVPEPGNPQSLNRYAYGLNNPMRYSDPSGYIAEDEEQTALGILKELLTYNVHITQDWGWLTADVPAGGGEPQAVWQEGNWQMEELYDAMVAVQLTAGAMGGREAFVEAFKAVRFTDYGSGQNLAYAITQVTTWSPPDDLAEFYGLSLGNGHIGLYGEWQSTSGPLVPVHELAHVWGARSGGRLPRGLARAVGSEEGPTDYSDTNAGEDWAESCTAHMFHDYHDQGRWLRRSHSAYVALMMDRQ